MKFSTIFQHRLAWKLFLSHLVVVLVGTFVLAGVSYVHAPNALSNHVSNMEELLGGDHGMAADLRNSFLDAILENLVVAGITAAVVAIVTSSLVAWRIVVPLRKLTNASRRIAAGDYSRRVQVTSEDELGALAGSFNRMAEALDQTEQRRTELIGNVAHELKSPLTTIRSMTEGLIDGVLPASEETFLEMQKEASRLQRLTSELSELSRAEAGALSLRYEPADPRQLVRDAANRLRPQFQDKDVTLTVELPEVVPTVEMDSERILQVVRNLLGNALQYTEPGGSVRLQCRSPGEELCIAVSDTGIGIPPEDLPRLFERFFRVDKSRARSRGGSGIGLTIAAHIVRAHGGTIDAESRGPGYGSTFRFCIPIAGNGGDTAKRGDDGAV